jgi:hypothetical protein
LLAWHRELATARTQPLLGIWQVEEIQPGSVGLAADEGRWRRLAIDTNGRGAVQYGFVRFVVLTETATRMITLRQRGDTTAVAHFSFIQEAPGLLSLDGTIGHEGVAMRLRREPSIESLLMTRGFHWISPVSFNR